MDKKSREQLAAERLENAQRIAREVREGKYQPPAFDDEMSFFPPRPVVKKDDAEIARIFGKTCRE